MKKVLLVFCLFTSIRLAAQDTLAVDTTWKKGGYGSLVFNQVAFDNWAAGGENSLSFTAIAFGFANYLERKNFWNNYLMLQYGLINSQYQNGLRKNTDLLEMQSKAGHEIWKKFYATGLVNFRTQFTDGFTYPNDSVVVSTFMSPAYLTISVGIEWKPVDYFSLYLSPATGRFTFVLDDAVANQVVAGASLWGTEPAVYDTVTGALITPGKNVRSELGAYLAAQFSKDVMKNVNLTTRLSLFNNYSDQNKENRTSIDVLYDLLLNMKLSSWLSTAFYLSVIYDQDIYISDLDENGVPTGTGGPRTQLKEGFGIGLSYNFGHKLN